MEDGFRVGVGFVVEALALQVLAQFLVVVDLAINAQGQVSVRRDEWLRSRHGVNDSQALVAEGVVVDDCIPGKSPAKKRRVPIVLIMVMHCQQNTTTFGEMRVRMSCIQLRYDSCGTAMFSFS